MSSRIQPFEAVPIGVVHSTVTSIDAMPLAGVPASVEVFPQYAAALDGVDEYSHLFVFSFMDQAARDVLRASPRKLGQGLPEHGVFAMRSPARPNPIGMCVVRLLGRDGSTLRVQPLDAVDGTPVIDIKPYAHGWDSVFSARSQRSIGDPRFTPADTLADVLRVAANFHGEVCAGIVIGARATITGLRELGLLGEPRGTKRLIAFVESDRCMTDAVMAITGCTPGRRTLKVINAGKMAATFVDLTSGRAVRVTPAPGSRPPKGGPPSPEEMQARCRQLAEMDEKDLLVVREVDVPLKPEDRPGPPAATVTCATCGESVLDRREVLKDGVAICRSCAGDRFYSERQA
jgi:tRNA-Thr(GGU) m(6)t(6)A37 methyltransferase TsaA